MWPELLSLALRPFHVDVRRNVGLVLKGSVDQVRQAVQRVRLMPINGVEITGYQALDPSCAFLAQLSAIQFVRLFAFPLTDMESLQSLKELRDIEIAHVARRQAIAIDFGALPRLEHAAIEWFEGADSIFRVSVLKSLGLMHYPSSSSEAFGKLTMLMRLRLAGGRLTDVDALGRLPSLKWLGLHDQKYLEDFAGLSGHPTLGFLWIEGCRRLRRIDWLAGMDMLETLQIFDCGEISGIEIVQSLPRLRHIHIHGSVKVLADDLSFLREMPNLESVVLKGLPDAEADHWRRRNKRYDLLRPDLTA